MLVRSHTILNTFTSFLSPARTLRSKLVQIPFPHSTSPFIVSLNQFYRVPNKSNPVHNSFLTRSHYVLISFPVRVERNCNHVLAISAQCCQCILASPYSHSTLPAVQVVIIIVHHNLHSEGSGKPVPDSVTSHSSIADVAGASLSHPDTAGLMGAIP